MKRCDLCAEAEASSARHGGVVECVCGKVYGAHPLLQLSRGTGRVYQAPPEAPPTPARAPEDRRPPSGLIESPELVSVRCLLSELRPDRRGKYSWAPDAEPPASPDSADTLGPLAQKVDRVQTSPEVPTIMPGAFVGERMASLGEEAAARIAAMPGLQVRRVLWWLQDYGTLARGLGPLYEALALAEAAAVLTARWERLDAGSARTARRGWGKARVAEAAAAWWSDRATRFAG